MVGWLGACMWRTPCLLSWVLGYSRKIPKGWVDIDIFLKKALGMYIFVTLPLENKLLLLEIPQIWATPPGNSKTKKLRPMENPHDFFLITPTKSTFFNWFWNFCLLLPIPLQIRCPESPLFVFFFWNRAVIKNAFE